MKNFFTITINDNIRLYLEVLTLLLIISATFGFVAAELYPQAAREGVTQAVSELGFLEEFGPVGIFLIILFNNAIKTLAMMFLGILFGVFPVLFILLNGYAIGVVASVVAAQTSALSIIAGTLPHGIFEIPAMIFAAGYGVWLGEVFYKKLKHKGTVKPHVRAALSAYWRVVFPLLVLAAFIESFITAPLLVNFIL
ncbi:MAG: stage II sporulation protein M [Patescibacteria group bacterium]|nr:MAG: stage II sporulation protein M [Patescibacteria group bacterium]